MNARQKELRFSIEVRQVDDVVSCIFHSLIIQRSLPKFQYHSPNHCTPGSLGFAEVDCEHVDLTYMCINSPQLRSRISNEVRYFKSEVESLSIGSPRRTPVGSPMDSAIHLTSSSINMEFYQKKYRPWPMSSETHPWERWNVVLDIYQVNSLDELSKMRETVAESLGDAVLSICSEINRPQYLPKIPSQAELGNVFDTSFSDFQPYLYKINRQTNVSVGTPALSVSSFRRLLKDFTL